MTIQKVLRTLILILVLVILGEGRGRYIPPPSIAPTYAGDVSVLPGKSYYSPPIANGPVSSLYGLGEDML